MAFNFHPQRAAKRRSSCNVKGNFSTFLYQFPPHTYCGSSLPSKDEQNTPLFSSRDEQNTPLFSSRDEQNTPLFSSRDDSRDEQNTTLFSSRDEQNTTLFSSRDEQNTTLFSSRDEQNTTLFSSRDEQNTPLFSYRASVLHALGDGDKPLVTFIPDWRKMFYNETLTIACLGGKGQQTYTWYRNTNKLDTNQQNFTIASIQLYDRANYQCQAGNSDISELARQHVITDLAILRVPRYVFEGDILNFNCDSRLDVNTTNAKVTFYKDFKYLKGKSTETSLFIGKVDNSMSGKYKCSKEAYLNDAQKTSDDEENIEIIELFSLPELDINPNPIQVGSNMVLTCIAVLHPLRTATELQFAFYRNGWHVQGFSSSNTFTIPSVSLQDSGDYACEVQTLTNSVRKRSKVSSIQVQVVEKPTVVFYPNVDKILRTEQIAVKCVTSKFTWSQKYTWYKNNNAMTKSVQSFSVYGAGDNDIGNYQCQTNSGEKSDPVHLDVFFVWLILQAPNFIHEGDPVILNCHMWRSGVAKNTTFYKDDKMLKFLDNLFELDLGVASKDTSGKYKCTRFINTGSASKVYTAEEFISVADLFSPPEIKVSPYSMIEGADMTLTCHTVLSPRRQSTQLLFAFYKDGQPVRNLLSSEKYEVQSAQPKDSGNYTCKVQNVQGIVSKMSKVTPIQIQGMAVVAFKPNVGKIITGESMSFLCNVDSNMKGDQTFYWYKDNDKIQETQQRFTIQSASVNDSGYYQCRSSVTHLSEPIRLDVSNTDLILQAPPIINEGDDLMLGCHHRPGLDISQVEFYKDGVFMKILDSESDLRLGVAYRNMSGSYRCIKKRSSYTVNSYLAEVFVSVTELFPYLQLKASQDVIVEGESLVLTCQTALNSALSPLRGKTEIQYAFYRDGGNVQPFSTSYTYSIVSAKRKDSGNYTCEVKSSMNTMTKISEALSVDIQDLFSTPNIYVNANPVTQGSNLIVTCDTTLNSNRQSTSLEYTIYKNGKPIQKSKFSTKYRADRVNEDHSGEYTCEVASSSGLVKKSNATHVQVQVPVLNAKITADHQETDMASGHSVTFKCSVQSGTAPSFTWLHNGKELDHNCILYDITHDGKVLFINSTQSRHSGTYQCLATNGFSDSMSKILRINVTEPATTATRSEEVKCPRTESNNPYVVPSLIVVFLVVIITVAIAYRYRHRLPIAKLPFYQKQVSVLDQACNKFFISILVPSQSLSKYYGQSFNRTTRQLTLALTPEFASSTAPHYLTLTLIPKLASSTAARYLTLTLTPKLVSSTASCYLILALTPKLVSSTAPRYLTIAITPKLASSTTPRYLTLAMTPKLASSTAPPYLTLAMTFELAYFTAPPYLTLALTPELPSSTASLYLTLALTLSLFLLLPLIT
ncbi:basement membrane-specific heparan sulfate proteoglycan core protein-like [Mantella aurantiaca]